MRYCFTRRNVVINSRFHYFLVLLLNTHLFFLLVRFNAIHFWWYFSMFSVTLMNFPGLMGKVGDNLSNTSIRIDWYIDEGYSNHQIDSHQNYIEVTSFLNSSIHWNHPNYYWSSQKRVLTTFGVPYPNHWGYFYRFFYYCYYWAVVLVSIYFEIHHGLLSQLDKRLGMVPRQNGDLVKPSFRLKLKFKFEIYFSLMSRWL